MRKEEVDSDLDWWAAHGKTADRRKENPAAGAVETSQCQAAAQRQPERAADAEFSCRKWRNRGEA